MVNILKDLKIFAPAANLTDIINQLEEGADEIYIGCIDDVWTQKYHRFNSAAISPNRREGRSYNFSSWDDVEEAVHIVHDFGKSISFALNEHCYSKSALDDLKEIINRVVCIGFDYVIIEDLFLIDYFSFANTHIKVNLSGDTMVLNSYGVKWFQERGVSRITFPQNITLPEIDVISRENPTMDFEVFILNGRCIFNSGTCFCMHGFQFIDGSMLPPLCANIADKSDCHTKWFQKRMKGVTCGICAISFFKQTPNITSLKIVGRDISPSVKLSLTKLIKMILSSPDNMYSEIYCKTFGCDILDCQNKLYCMYH